MIPLAVATWTSVVAAAEGDTPAAPWADYVEPDFPFFSSVVDARKSGGPSPAENLTARGLVLNLGDGVWACFDLDLLRIAAVWTGDAVTPMSMAQTSYQVWNRKSRGGEQALPRPAGDVWLANGIYPGGSIGAEVRLDDPRPAAPSVAEIGRGAIDPALGKFHGLQLTRGGLQLNYAIGNVDVSETIRAARRGGAPELTRTFRVGPSAEPMVLVLAATPSAASTLVASLGPGPGGEAVELQARADHRIAYIPPHAQAAEFCVLFSLNGDHAQPKYQPRNLDDNLPGRPHWPETLTTRGALSAKKDAFVVDDIALPLTNPWRRNIRPADIKFRPDGVAVTITVDGDVWLVGGLDENLSAVTWRRFASGLHEPLSLAIRDGEIFVYDRNGIWRLRDTAGTGEANVYELFSNVFTQTADGREFPTTISVAPDRSFVIAKGGQAGETTGQHNGTVLRVSADGRDCQVLGWGFRMPFAKVDQITGEVTASDQQGNYVPATPLYLLKKNEFHGFLQAFMPREQYPAPIAEPVTWIPHTACLSAVGQIPIHDPRLGPLNGDVLLLSYNLPEIFSVVLNRRADLPQAAVTSLTRDFRFPLLNGEVNAADGHVYVAGFKIFSTASDRIGGIARLRYTRQPSLTPREVVPMQKGILLRFDVPVDAHLAADVSGFEVERWNYKRSASYGSWHYLSDGSIGQEQMLVRQSIVSTDRKSVFLFVDDMRVDVMQMQLRWRLQTEAGMPMANTTYFTPRALSEFDGGKEGFGTYRIESAEPTPRPVRTPTPGSITEGARLAEVLGCLACHSTDGSARVGPTWKGLFGCEVTLTDGSRPIADGAFIRERLHPHPNKLVSGYATGMPDYSAVVSDTQATALIRYIESLK